MTPEAGMDPKLNAEANRINQEKVEDIAARIGPKFKEIMYKLDNDIPLEADEQAVIDKVKDSIH